MGEWRFPNTIFLNIYARYICTRMSICIRLRLRLRLRQGLFNQNKYRYHIRFTKTMHACVWTLYLFSIRIHWEYLHQECHQVSFRISTPRKISKTEKLKLSPGNRWRKSNSIFFQSHCNDVIMSAMASQITFTIIVYSTIHSGANQRKHQNSASLWGEFTGNRWIPRTKAGNAENASIWWRHHALNVLIYSSHWAPERRQ